MARTPSREEIERKAYEIYEERGCEDGHAEQDWLRAEQELTERLGAPAKRSPIKTAGAQAARQAKKTSRSAGDV